MINIDHLFQELRRLKREARDHNATLKVIQSPSRVFEPRVVEHVERTDEQWNVCINFEGLYGGLGALPGYFSDEILHQTDEVNALRDFLDIFNHRIIEALFDIWRSSQIFLENGVEAKETDNQEFDQFLRALAGVPSHEDQIPLYIKCLRRHHFSLYQRREKTVLGLANVLTSFFDGVDFEFEEHEERFIPIPSFQRAKLGGDFKLAIGKQGNMLIGTRIRDINGRFSIKVADLDYASYMRFLPGGDWHELVSGIVKSYTEDQWACGLKLELRADEIPKMQLGNRVLSANCWALSGAADQAALVVLGGPL